MICNAVVTGLRYTNNLLIYWTHHILFSWASFSDNSSLDWNDTMASFKRNEIIKNSISYHTKFVLYSNPWVIPFPIVRRPNICRKQLFRPKSMTPIETSNRQWQKRTKLRAMGRPLQLYSVRLLPNNHVRPNGTLSRMTRQSYQSWWCHSWDLHLRDFVGTHSHRDIWDCLIHCHIVAVVHYQRRHSVPLKKLKKLNWPNIFPTNQAVSFSIFVALTLTSRVAEMNGRHFQTILPKYTHIHLKTNRRQYGKHTKNKQ